MARPLLNVVGNLGTGKTTLTRILADRFGYHVEEESVHDNPFLVGFYAEMKRWAFHLEVYFFANRWKKQERALAVPSRAVVDGSLYGDFQVYCRLLQRFGHLSEDEFVTAADLYTALELTYPRPDLLVFLEASPAVLLSRIRDRSLGLDEGISKDYLQAVSTLFQEFISSFRLCPVLRIDSQRRDLRNASDPIYDEIAERVHGL